MWRQDAHERRYWVNATHVRVFMADDLNRELERGTERLFRIVPQLRRGRVFAKDPGAQILGADDNAHGVRHQPL